MKNKVFLIVLTAAIFGFLLQGCQSQKENEEAIQREKLKKWGEDFTPEKIWKAKESHKNHFGNNKGNMS